MLEFWFNPQVNLTKKLLFLAVVIALTATLYFIDPLFISWAVMVLIGVQSETIDPWVADRSEEVA